MIKIVLVYDEQDYDPVDQDGLGAFFQACADHVKAFVKSDERFNLTEILSADIAQNTVVNTLSDLRGNRFIFLAYSHGSENALLYDNKQQTYITASKDNHLFANSLFYTWACSCGQVLGPETINHGCKAFFGYNGLVFASASPHYIKGFVEVANSGLIALMEGDTIGQAYQKMRSQHNLYIDEVYSQDYMLASLHRSNRDSLVMLGADPSLILDYFLNI